MRDRSTVLGIFFLFPLLSLFAVFVFFLYLTLLVQPGALIVRVCQSFTLIYVVRAAYISVVVYFIGTCCSYLME